MNKYHIFVNIFWIGLSFFIIILSYKLDIGRTQSPGPGFMPFLLGLLLFPISLYLLMSSFVKRNKKTETTNEDQNQSNLIKVGVVVISLFGYVFLLEKLGFLLAIFLILIILFGCGGGKKRWKVILIASVLTGLVTYLGFSYLGVQLPAGILEF